MTVQQPETFVRYNRAWPITTTALQCELTMYLHYEKPQHFNAQQKLEHMKKAYALLFPEMIPTYNSWVEDMMRGFCEEAKVGGGSLAVLGASGTGKSLTFGYLYVLDFLADPDNTIILCASTTIAELNARIWKYLKRAHLSLPFDVGRLRRTKPEAIISPNGEGGLFAIAMDGDTEAERLKGFHPKRLRVCVDEATAVGPQCLNIWTNWTAADKNFCLVTLSNFRGMDNLSAAVTEPIHGWMSVDFETTTKWKTKQGGQALLLDALRSPVYLNPSLKQKLPFLKTKDEVDAVIYGTADKPGLGSTHPRVMQYIRSIPTFDEGAKTVLTRKLIEKGGAVKKAKWAGWTQTKLLSLDPAFVTGGDECILLPGTLGYEQDGVQVLEYGEPISVPIQTSSFIPTEYQILKYVVDYCVKHNISPRNFIMDGGGAGRGLGSIFQYEWSADVVVLMPGQSASEDIIEYDIDGRPLRACDLYDRKVTELWFEAKRYVETAQIRNFPKDAVNQFCVRLYEDAGKKIRLETKPEYKIRTVGEDSVSGSPDIGDAASYLLDLAKMHGLILANRTRTYAESIATDSRTPNERAVQEWLDKRTAAYEESRNAQQADTHGSQMECDYSGAVISDD